MVTRLMISLRKTAYSQGSSWTMGESTISRGPGRETYSLQFAPDRGPSNGQDDYSLVSFSEELREGRQLTMCRVRPPFGRN